MQDPIKPPVFTDILPPEAVTDPDTHYVRVTFETAEAHPEAMPEDADLSSTRKMSRKAFRKPLRKVPRTDADGSPAPASGPHRPRQDLSRVPRGENRAVVLAVARHRLLSLEQLKRSLFPGRTLQAVGQRVGRLCAEGWLRTWDQPVTPGGRPRFVLPTARTHRWAYHELRAATHGTLSATLVQTMFPARPPLPLTLEPGVTPPFFQHQKETNDLAISVATQTGLPLRWCSTWERPFPVAAGGITLPQPDAVFLLELPSGPRLICLEHDRGMEPVRHFHRTKTERYADLLARPELCARLFGTSALEVWVSVLDARERRPLQRLEALRRTASIERITEHMRFTLGGWLFAFAGGPVFFPRGIGPATDDVAARAHPLEPVTAGWEIPTPPATPMP